MIDWVSMRGVYSDFSLCMGLGLSVGSEHVESDDRQQTMERDVVRRL